MLVLREGGKAAFKEKCKVMTKNRKEIVVSWKPRKENFKMEIVFNRIKCI